MSDEVVTTEQTDMLNLQAELTAVVSPTPVSQEGPSEFGDIPLDKIRHLQGSLRPAKEKTVEFLELLESVRNKGVQNPITVRRAIDPNTKEEFYEAINGAQRTRASQLAGKTTIPARIMAMTDSEVLESQVLSNSVVVPTKKFEFAHALTTLMRSNRSHTTTSIGKSVGKGKEWVESVLSLVNLHPEIGALVDEGKIVAANAVYLAKLDPKIQLEYKSEAITKTADDFEQVIKTRLTALRKEAASNKPQVPVFVPVAHLRPLADIKAAATDADLLVSIAKSAGAKTTVDSMKAAIEWALSMDPTTLEEKKKAFDSEVALLAKKREESKQERLERKAFADGKKGERSSLDLRLSNEGKNEQERKEALEAFDKAAEKEAEAKWPKAKPVEAAVPTTEATPQ